RLPPCRDGGGARRLDLRLRLYRVATGRRDGFHDDRAEDEFPGDRAGGSHRLRIASSSRRPDDAGLGRDREGRVRPDARPLPVHATLALPAPEMTVSTTLWLRATCYGQWAFLHAPRRRGSDLVALSHKVRF